MPSLEADNVTADCTPIKPRVHDVLMGRRHGNFLHPGNVKFRRFLATTYEAFNKVSLYVRQQSVRTLSRFVCMSTMCKRRILTLDLCLSFRLTRMVVN
jgi:hypothetical protein